MADNSNVHVKNSLRTRLILNRATAVVGHMIFISIIILTLIYQDYKITGSVYEDPQTTSDYGLYIVVTIASVMQLYNSCIPPNKGFYIANFSVFILQAIVAMYMLIRQASRAVDCINVASSFCIREKTVLTVSAIIPGLTFLHAVVGSILIMNLFLFCRRNKQLLKSNKKN